MYRLQVMCGKRWRWGIQTYNTMLDAMNRVKELSVVGIKARVKPETELFN